MKKTRFIFCLLFCVYNYSLMAQEMQKGFAFLETGKYKNATVFFKAILKEYPNNRTAKLCYGRAVGLNGNSNKAVDIFTALLKDYPNDFEIKLNYAESLLWNKQFKPAKSYYQKLVQVNNKSFPALLGFANTLSNLKEYKAALVYVNKALMVLPNNQNAMVSKKYIYLGLANQQLQQQYYTKAIETLKQNLQLFPDDKDVYLNLANTYVVAKKYNLAIETYNTMAKNPMLYFTAKNGLALISHLQKKDKKALEISHQTLSKIKKETAKKDRQDTQERYAQTLIWNRKFNTAKRYIDQISKGKENKNWILALQATLQTYTGDFKQSIKSYNAILKNDKTSFDGNLGKANALKANNQIQQAYLSGQQTLSFFPKQKDAVNLIQKMDNQYVPVFKTDGNYSYDNGNSKAYTATSSINIPVNFKLKLLANHQYKKATNEVTDNNSTSNLFDMGLGYQLHPTIHLMTTIGVNNVAGNKNNYNQLIANVLLKTKPYRLQNLNIGYKRELQNFNAALLNREIIQNHFYANYNVSTTFNLGWFTQYFFTTQNDQNQRNLLFTSLYYQILQQPALKSGINFQYLQFKNQVPTIYFSPKTFYAAEVFVNLIKDKAITNSKNWYYGLTAALGYQYVEEASKQSTYRIQSNLGYKFSEYCLLASYFNHSNIASAAASGFTFTEFGLKLTWRFLKKPIFKTLQKI